jgi:glycogen debranching enzyme
MYGNVSSAAFKKYPATLCAGLPHFSTGYMRCWGRDTFISLKGIFIHNGLHQSALDTILYFASVSRHSLIPNLHDQGKNTRFNARDATWFWLQAIKDYIQATNNYECLNELVQQHFQKNNQIKLGELVNQILQAHHTGIRFRELRAGYEIDAQMLDEGFNIDIYTDPTTGFTHGGNKYNCGTWMDKMGSVNKVNKGIPATPRDGAPIELVAL